MSMHLHHPSLSTTGKRRGKQKFRNAEEARKSRELAESWAELQKKWAPSVKVAPKNGSLSDSYKLTNPRSTQHIKSLVTDGGNATLSAPKVYTGTKVKGIATMHKSNAVPVFSDEEAVDISRMRR